MKLYRHENLFAYGNKEEVYKALQRDLSRDTWHDFWWGLIFFGSAYGGVYYAGHDDWIWIFLGLFSTIMILRRFIDNSNRNWAMHIIDWIEASRPNDQETNQGEL